MAGYRSLREPAVAAEPGPRHQLRQRGRSARSPIARRHHAGPARAFSLCSNRFLEEEFRTIRFQCNVTIYDADSFSYEEDTQIEIRDQADLFHHHDVNRLVRTR